MTSFQSIEVQVPQELVHYWGWLLAFGVGLVLLGIAAIGRAVTATVATMLFFGWLLLLACGIEVAQAILVGHWVGFFHHLLAAILFGVVGGLLVSKPVLRGPDDRHGGILHGRWPVSSDWVHNCRPAGLGLAIALWRDHVRARRARVSPMAGLWSLGDRHVRWNRPHLL